MVKVPFASEPLTERHATSAFACGRTELDEWLQRSALHAQANRTARTFIWHGGDDRVLAYFSLSAAAARRDELAKRVARGSPEVVPSVLLARLALDRSLQGAGLGGWLLFDASRRVVAATEYLGARLLLVDAIDDDAARFYERHGFKRVPGQLRLSHKISDLAAAVTQAARES